MAGDGVGRGDIVTVRVSRCTWDARVGVENSLLAEEELNGCAVGAVYRPRHLAAGLDRALERAEWWTSLGFIVRVELEVDPRDESERSVCEAFVRAIEACVPSDGRD